MITYSELGCNSFICESKLFNARVGTLSLSASTLFTTPSNSHSMLYTLSASALSSGSMADETTAPQEIESGRRYVGVYGGFSRWTDSESVKEMEMQNENHCDLMCMSCTIYVFTFNLLRTAPPWPHLHLLEVALCFREDAIDH
jgi:hypothetical protein